MRFCKKNQPQQTADGRRVHNELFRGVSNLHVFRRRHPEKEIEEEKVPQNFMRPDLARGPGAGRRGGSLVLGDPLRNSGGDAGSWNGGKAGRRGEQNQLRVHGKVRQR